MSNGARESYPESLYVNVGLDDDPLGEEQLRALEQAGLYDIKVFEGVEAILGSVASIEWLDNIALVPGVEYVEEQASRQLVTPVELEQHAQEL